MTLFSVVFANYESRNKLCDTPIDYSLDLILPNAASLAFPLDSQESSM